jgi:glutathione S-transferase
MIKILGRKTSSNVQNVLVALSETGTQFERVDIGGEFGGNDQPDYLAMNPNGLVPTLIDGDHIQWESCSCIRYIGAKYGSDPFYPADPARRGDADKWMDWHLTTSSAAIRPVFWGMIRTPPEKRDMKAIGEAVVALGKTLGILDRHLADRAFINGDAMSIADIPLGIITYRWFAMDIDRPGLPNLKAWFDRLADRDSFKTHVIHPLV